MPDHKPMTYQDILEMDAEPFAMYITSFLSSVNCEVNSIETMQAASKHLGELTNLERKFADMQAWATIMKRKYKRLETECKGKQTEEKKKEDADPDYLEKLARKQTQMKYKYEDMVDKEKAIDCVASAVKEQARALSKSINVHVENNKELYMTDAYAGIRQPKR